MERRTFVAVTGMGIGTGIAGCLDGGAESSDGDETTDHESDDDGGRDETADDDSEEDETADDERDDEDESAHSPTVDVIETTTNSPVGGGELLEVVAAVENVGDASGSVDVSLVVGHDPTVEDGQTVTLEPGETDEITLAFRAGEPTGDVETFPVRVDTGTHDATETVAVEADGGDDDPGDGVTFESCTRATVEGPFEDGDVVYASTGFYDQAGFGNTIMEDGVSVGDDVDAPFTGTIVFEVGDESGVADHGDEIVVSVNDYGQYGTVISGLTTERDDYLVAGITHGNPHAGDCLAEIESEWEADVDDERG